MSKLTYKTCVMVFVTFFYAAVTNGASVMDYGAVGDGTTDDTAAIQSAINANKGSTITFPKGTYRITSSINLNSLHYSGTILEGKGMTMSRIQNESGDYAFKFTGGANFAADAVTRCKIRQMRIVVPSGQSGGGIKFYNTYFMEIEKIEVDSRGFPAVSVVDFFQVAIRDCHLRERNYTSSTLYLNSIGGNSGQFSAENTIFKEGGIGVEIASNSSPMDGVTFIACAFNNAVNTAIKIGSNTRHVSVMGSHIEGNATERVTIDGYSIFGVMVKNNHFSTGTTTYNIVNRGGNGVEVTQNQMINNATVGIRNESGFISIYNNNIWTAPGFVGTSCEDLTAGERGVVKVNSIRSKSAAPTAGTWKRGDIVYNTNPVSGGYIGWICVYDGTPGTWKAFGKIQ